jgi:hypothetical protein
MTATKRQVAKRVVLVVIVLLSLVVLVAPVLGPWTHMNCRHRDVDINTGRLRVSRYLGYWRVSETVQDSPLSRVVLSEAASAITPDWRHVNTSSPLVRHSPHYAFRGAAAQIHMLAGLWESYEFSQKMRKKTAWIVLCLWEHDEGDSLAEDYIDTLGLMLEADREKTLKGLSTLEMGLIFVCQGHVNRNLFYPNGQAMLGVGGYMDSSFNLVCDGICERWWPNGKRRHYGRFRDNRPHGPQFHWNRDGRLTAIEVFDRGRLVEHSAENVTDHPAYKNAQELAAKDTAPDTFPAPPQKDVNGSGDR